MLEYVSFFIIAILLIILELILCYPIYKDYKEYIRWRESIIPVVRHKRTYLNPIKEIKEEQEKFYNTGNH